MYSQHQILFLNGESAGVTPAPTEGVALWVVCSLNVARLANVFNFVYSRVFQSLSALQVFNLKEFQKACLMSFAGTEENSWWVKISPKRLPTSLEQKQTMDWIICQAVKNYCCHQWWGAKKDKMKTVWKMLIAWENNFDRFSEPDRGVREYVTDRQATQMRNLSCALMILLHVSLLLEKRLQRWGFSSHWINSISGKLFK